MYPKKHPKESLQIRREWQVYHIVTVINQDISTSIISGINTSMSKHDYIGSARWAANQESKEQELLFGTPDWE